LLFLSTVASQTGTGVTRISGAAAERAVHVMRSAHDAIAVGSETAIADDPQLTVRGVRRPRVEPIRIVFDRRGRLPVTSKLVRTAKKLPTILVTAAEGAGDGALRDAGVEVIRADSLRPALTALHTRGIDSILCEGGATLGGALLAEGFVDRLVIFQAPLILGPGATNAFAYPAGDVAALTPRWRMVEQSRLEDDVMTVYAPQR
jgi:diaminohydroxyphosphoribosylaminopyrimidine deaminase/5-amino-6-(5-phosphoribosylamino)uracil reductase